MSDTVKAGSFVVLMHIAKCEGLYDILQRVYGEKNAVKLLDILIFLSSQTSLRCFHAMSRLCVPI